MDENCLSLEVAGKPDAEVTARWRSTTIRQAAPGSFLDFETTVENVEPEVPNSQVLCLDGGSSS